MPREGRVSKLARLAVETRQVVRTHRCTNSKTSTNRQQDVTTCIERFGLPAIATVRRVRDEWRVYVIPFDEA